MNAPSIHYVSLAYYILPPSILDWFELVDTNETPIVPGTDAVFTSVLHLYLDERDNRSASEQSSLRPNGFTESTQIHDFPIRDRKVILHVRRRRWLDSGGKNVLVNTYPLTANGTRYSEEFAAFLKGAFGYVASDGPFRGSVLDG
jgi:hypothetical protein